MDGKRDSPGGPGAEPEYDANGVDRTLIRWMLTLTPTERLRYLDETLAFVATARRAPDGTR